MRNIYLLILFILFDLSVLSQTFTFDISKTESCNSLSTKLTNTSSDTVNYSFEWHWRDQVSVLTSNVNADFPVGRYEISMIVKELNGTLVTTITDSVFVYANPVVEISALSSQSCINQGVWFKVVSLNSEAPVTFYRWSLGDGKSSNMPDSVLKSYSVAGIYKTTLFVRDENGCESGESDPVSVNIASGKPTVDFDLSASKVCADNLEVVFANTSTASTGASIISLDWDFGNGETASTESATISYVGYGNYPVQLRATQDNGCFGVANETVILENFNASIAAFHLDKPLFNVLLDESTLACPGNILLKNTGSAASYYSWDIGNDGTVDYEGGTFYSSITHNFETAGEYPVKLSIRNTLGCNAEFIDTIKVEGPVEISGLPNGLFSCDKNEIHDLSVQLVPNVDSILWYVNGTLIEKNTTNIQTTLPEGILDLKLDAITTNGCKTSQNVDSFIEVKEPDIFITLVSGASGCIPLNVSLVATTNYTPITASDAITLTEWDFNGDGVADKTNTLSVSNTYNQTGTHYSRLTVHTEKGCEISSQYEINAGDNTVIDYSLPTEICTWESIQFQLLSDLDPLSSYDTLWYSLYSMDYETIKVKEFEPINPPVDENPIHFDDTTGYYTLAIMLSDHGCRTDTLFDDSVMFVKGPIVATMKEVDCANPFSHIFRASKLIDVDDISWKIYAYDTIYPYPPMTHNIPQYQVIDSSKQYPLNFTFADKGDYRVEIITESFAYPQCSDTSVLEFVPVRDLIVDFDLNKYEVCAGESLLFNPDTITLAQDMIAKMIEVKYADTIVTRAVTSKEYIHGIEYVNDQLLYPKAGDVTVTLHAEDLNGCKEAASKQVTVFQPKAGFTIDNFQNCLPYTVVLNDNSTSVAEIVERIWNTGCDTSDFTGNKTVVSDIVSVKGVKNPSLTVFDSHGCSDMVTISSGIIPLVPDARFDFVTHKICSNGAIEVVLPKDTSSTYYKPVDSTQWWLNGLHTLTTIGGGVPDAFVVDSAGIKELIAVSFKESVTGDVCVYSDTLSIQVKDMKINLPFNGTNICKDAGKDARLDLKYEYDSVYTGFEDVISIKWYIDGNLYITQDNKADYIVLSKEGYQNVKMVVESEYNGCELLADSIDVYVYGKDISIAVDKDTICVGEEIHIDASNLSFLSGVPHYWLPGDGARVEGTGGNISYTYAKLPDNGQSLVVTFRVDEDAPENSNSCKSIVSTDNVKLYPVMADFLRGVNDSVITGCAPLTVDLINISEGDENQYVWHIDTTDIVVDSTVGDTIHYTFSESGKTFNIVLELTNSNCTQAATKAITTFADPEITMIADDTVVCNYEIVNIEAQGNYTKVNHWEWFNKVVPVTNNSIAGTFDSTTYVVISYQSADACNFKDSVKIYSQYRPYYSGAPDRGLLHISDLDTAMLLDDKATFLIVNELYNVNNIFLDGVSYKWEPSNYLSCNDCASPNILLECGGDINCSELPEKVEYTVFMTDSLECFPNESHTISFTIKKETKIGLPSAFTPNGDGLNDYAIVRSWALVDFIEMKIYNRWGQMIFETTDKNEGWDGTYRGEPQKAGSYAYIIRATDTENEEILVKGFITLLR